MKYGICGLNKLQRCVINMKDFLSLKSCGQKLFDLYSKAFQKYLKSLIVPFLRP